MIIQIRLPHQATTLHFSEYKIPLSSLQQENVFYSGWWDREMEGFFGQTLAHYRYTRDA